MPGIESYGPSPRGYPFRRAGYSGGPSNAGFQKAATGWMALDAEARKWRSPLGTPSSGGSALLEAEARVLGETALGRGIMPNRMGSLLPAAPRVPWDLPGNMQGRGYVPRALRGALLPLNLALLGLDLWSAWSQFSAWWKHPNSGQIDPSAFGWTVTCDTGLGGVGFIQGGYPCGFGIYVPENTPAGAAPGPMDNTATVMDPADTMGYPPGAYYLAARSNWYRDISQEFRPAYPNTSAAMMLSAIADPALDYGSKAADARAQKLMARQMRRAGYAAPEGYSLTDPLIAVRERTSAWWRQFPEYAGNTYTYPDVAGKFGNRPPIKSRPVRNNYKKPFNQELKFRRTKERKGGGVGRILLAELVTEGCDFVKALFEALPEFRQRQATTEHVAGWPSDGYNTKPSAGTDARRRYSGKRVEGTRAKQVAAETKFGTSTAKPPRVGCQNMAAAVWNHADEIDIDKAMGNVVKQGLEDLALGKLSSKAAKAFGKANLGLGNNSPRGPGWGPAL